MHHSNENSTKYFGIFSALQYATEINFFLLVSIFVLFVDNFFIKIHHYGLVQFSKQYETISINPIEIITIFIAFLFTTSIIQIIIWGFHILFYIFLNTKITYCF